MTTTATKERRKRKLKSLFSKSLTLKKDQTTRLPIHKVYASLGKLQTSIIVIGSFRSPARAIEATSKILADYVIDFSDLPIIDIQNQGESANLPNSQYELIYERD